MDNLHTWRRNWTIGWEVREMRGLVIVKQKMVKDITLFKSITLDVAGFRRRGFVGFTTFHGILLYSPLSM